MKQLLIALMISLSSVTISSGEEQQPLKSLMNKQGKLIGFVTENYILNLDKKLIGNIERKHFVSWVNTKGYKAIISNGFMYDLDGNLIARVGE